MLACRPFPPPPPAQGLLPKSIAPLPKLCAPSTCDPTHSPHAGACAPDREGADVGPPDGPRATGAARRASLGARARRPRLTESRTGNPWAGKPHACADGLPAPAPPRPEVWKPPPPPERDPHPPRDAGAVATHPRTGGGPRAGQAEPHPSCTSVPTHAPGFSPPRAHRTKKLKPPAKSRAGASPEMDLLWQTKGPRKSVHTLGCNSPWGPAPGLSDRDAVGVSDGGGGATEDFARRPRSPKTTCRFCVVRP